MRRVACTDDTTRFNSIVTAIALSELADDLWLASTSGRTIDDLLSADNL